MGNIRIVRTSFLHESNGHPEIVQEGATFREGHPLISAYPKMFWPANHVDYDYVEDVEPVEPEPEPEPVDTDVSNSVDRDEPVKRGPGRPRKEYRA